MNTWYEGGRNARGMGRRRGTWYMEGDARAIRKEGKYVV